MLLHGNGLVDLRNVRSVVVLQGNVANPAEQYRDKKIALAKDRSRAPVLCGADDEGGCAQQL
jgi:hypothetical protein